ncbi:hypoxanthine phosphoribosyltransferase [Candidatus Mycoplasma mahonii]|uniref:hypoxanthine phosphoribosyltransferase n=1 Tax=Candidatus Mycoplasma mahonii TaxID=3004105 RepID=UPI0026F159C8|nr:hypoxanthine phosphoribosyltransferase [Candidatus Mycoplasma mahonii]WKX02310.1 hypoxanthine phosphoribosyltransferase [Candidatus Mycoplasma mahonii]
MTNDKYAKEILITRSQIEDKCVELAKWVDHKYKGSRELILIGLLKGCIPFMAELMKSIKVEHKLDFMTVSSFAGKMESNKQVKIIMDLKSNIANKDVLIVEDIVDSGRTLKKTIDILKKRDPKSLTVLTLLYKPEGQIVKFKVDKYGFKVPNKFVYGFGLDVKEKLRNAPYIAVFDKKYFDKL